MITSKPIPEQILQTGQTVALDLSVYFDISEDDSALYTIDQFPQGLSVDAATGIVQGIAMNVPINTPFLVSVTATSRQTQQSATEYFPITIVPVATAQSAEEISQGMFNQVLEDTSYFTKEQRWLLQQWLQFIIQEHYPAIYIYNGEYPPNMFGDLIQKRQAESGFDIFNYPNYVIVAAGEMSFAEGSNQGRLLRALEEAYKVDVSAKNWPIIGITGTDKISTAKAWVLGKFMNLPVSEKAPNNEAIFNFRNLARLRGIPVEPGIFPTPEQTRG